MGCPFDPAARPPRKHQPGWLMNNRGSFLRVLEAGMSELKARIDSVSAW